MAYGAVKTEGGNVRGHSNMTHWQKTAEVKEYARKARRAQDRHLSRTQNWDS